MRERSELGPRRHAREHEHDAHAGGLRRGDIGVRAVAHEQRTVRIATGTLQRGADQIRRRFADHCCRPAGRDLDRREDRAGSREEPGLYGVGRIAIRTDERNATARNVGSQTDVVHDQLRVPRDDESGDIVHIFRRHVSVRTQHLGHASCGAYVHTLAA